ncbi:MAG: hypothetical protein AABX70_06530 [Nanoarchaeota archaeon]
MIDNLVRNIGAAVLALGIAEGAIAANNAIEPTKQAESRLSPEYTAFVRCMRSMGDPHLQTSSETPEKRVVTGIRYLRNTTQPNGISIRAEYYESFSDEPYYTLPTGESYFGESAHTSLMVKTPDKGYLKQGVLIEDYFDSELNFFPATERKTLNGIRVCLDEAKDSAIMVNDTQASERDRCVTPHKLKLINERFTTYLTMACPGGRTDNEE